MTSHIRSFIQGRCFLNYDPHQGLIPVPLVNSNTVVSIKAIAVNLFYLQGLTRQEDTHLLSLISGYASLDKPYVTNGISKNFMDGSVKKITGFIRGKWLADYIFSNPNTREVAKGFVANMEQSTSYLYKDHIFFEKGLNSFITLYANASPELRQILAALSKTYPHVFSACHDQNSSGFALARILEKNDPLHIKCLAQIATNGKRKDHLLSNWIHLEKGRDTLHIDSVLHDLYRLYSKAIFPTKWIERTIQELLNFTDVQVNNTLYYALAHLADASIAHRSFFDFYFFLKMGSPYDHEALKALYPLENSQPSYKALLHQSVLIAKNGLEKADWNFDHILALMMLRINYIALILHEDQADQVALPRPREEKCLATTCSNPVEEILRAHLSTHMEIEGDGYQLIATLGTQQFVHSTVILSDQVVIEHTKDPQTRKQILKGLGQLFEEAKKEPNPVDLNKKLGLIFWWTVRAKIWLAGEIEIAEGVVRSLAQMRNAPLPAWKAGIVPLDEVMKCLDPNEFAEKFDSFFGG